MQKNSDPTAVQPGPAYPISSVDNALRLLCLFRERRSLRLTDACAYLEVAHSTAHRLLAMLVHHGFVQQDQASRAYRPGPTLIEIGLAVVQKMDVRTQARPLLERLAAQFDETVHLVTLEGDQVRFIDAVESKRALRVAPRTGNLLPAHCTSAGKALLAELSADQLRKLYPNPDTLSTKTKHSLSKLEALLDELAEVKRNGFATNSEESEEGVGSVAIALHDLGGAPVAAAAVAVPLSRLTDDARDTIVAALRALAPSWMTPSEVVALPDL